MRDLPKCLHPAAEPCEMFEAEMFRSFKLPRDLHLSIAIYNESVIRAQSGIQTVQQCQSIAVKQQNSGLDPDSSTTHLAPIIQRLRHAQGGQRHGHRRPNQTDHRFSSRTSIGNWSSC